MSFKSDELKRQLFWKNTTTTLSARSLRPGFYTGPPGDRTPERAEMFLHEEQSDENLLPAGRAEALAMFGRAGIPWHDYPGGQRPSNYLMDSMVSCVNCLMPFAHDGLALATLLRPLVPDAIDAVPVEDDRVVTFEWMGDGNPLGETSPKRKRGSHGTSVDAYCELKRADGGRTAVLVEWKYTETYPKETPKYGAPYLPLLEAPDAPVDLARCGGAEALFVDPVYQLARLQLLAQATERATGTSCDRAIVVLIVPENNRRYREHIPGARLRQRFLGLSLGEVWATLLRRPDRFGITSFERLMSEVVDERFPALLPALREVRARYLASPEHS